MQRLKYFVKYIFILIFMILSVVCVVAQSSSDINRKIDAAFRSKDINALKEVIAEKRKAKDYPAVESYILKNSRDLLINNELDFAAEATMALIDANMDNFEALSFYTSVEKAIAKRNEQQKAEEQKKQLEEFRRQNEESRTKDTIKREYKPVTNVSSGETVFLDQDYNMRFGQISWGFYLGVADIGVVLDAGNFSPKYGLAANLNIMYHSDSFSIGGEAFADILLMPFAGYLNILTSIKASAVGSINRISRHLTFRAGYVNTITSVDRTTDATTSIPEEFLGPTFGIGFKDFSAGNFTFNGYADYNFGHLFCSGVNTSFEVGVNALLEMADLNNLKVGLNLALIDTFSLTTLGIHNQTKIIISIGVGKND